MLSFQPNISPEAIDSLEYKSFEGQIVVIDAPGKEYDAAVRYLKSKKILGFDTESRPSFSADQPSYGTALLQLSGEEKAFLFRIKQCGINAELASVLADREILKVGAAVKDDVYGLKKYAKFHAAGFVDLQRMVEAYGIGDKSVKKMAAIILGIHISKAQQCSNWEAEELSKPQMLYAATDAWVCREMYKTLLSSDIEPVVNGSHVIVPDFGLVDFTPKPKPAPRRPALKKTSSQRVKSADGRSSAKFKVKGSGAGNKWAFRRRDDRKRAREKARAKAKAAQMAIDDAKA